MLSMNMCPGTWCLSDIDVDLTSPLGTPILAYTLSSVSLLSLVAVENTAKRAREMSNTKFEWRSRAWRIP